MKLEDIVDKIYIDPRKLTHYVLDISSPHGKHKAVLFEKLLGFTKENYTSLLYEIESRAMQSEITFHSQDHFGKRYLADITVQGTEGREAVVRTGWLIHPETKEANLVTLYIRKKT
ncbi:MAG: hypothetical protein HQK71_07010 [Desulfamplus sp.]|nr:hypothetical protein [Desulfamplus sp.]